MNKKCDESGGTVFAYLSLAKESTRELYTGYFIEFVWIGIWNPEVSNSTIIKDIDKILRLLLTILLLILSTVYIMSPIRVSHYSLFWIILISILRIIKIGNWKWLSSTCKTLHGSTFEMNCCSAGWKLRACCMTEFSQTTFIVPENVVFTFWIIFADNGTALAFTYVNFPMVNPNWPFIGILIPTPIGQIIHMILNWSWNW